MWTYKKNEHKVVTPVQWTQSTELATKRQTSVSREFRKLKTTTQEIKTRAQKGVKSLPSADRGQVWTESSDQTSACTRNVSWAGSSNGGRTGWTLSESQVLGEGQSGERWVVKHLSNKTCIHVTGAWEGQPGRSVEGSCVQGARPRRGQAAACH